MSETIKSISEVFGRQLDSYSYDGYEIQTDRQRIFFGIANFQSCCEEWGYLSTVDNPGDCIGARIVEITRTDVNLNTREFRPNSYGEFPAIFVNIVTDRGVFQLTAYNRHNGYYGHSVKMLSDQLTLSEDL